MFIVLDLFIIIEYLNPPLMPNEYVWDDVIMIVIVITLQCNRTHNRLH